MGIEQEDTKQMDFTGEKKKERYLYIALGAAFAIGVLIAVFAWRAIPTLELDSYLSEQPAAEPIPEEPADTRVPSLLNGELVEPEVQLTRPLAIMVENHTSSRPPTGLIDADVVYEVPVEGDISRYLAIYQQHQPEKVGPERSARVYFLEWVSEYDAVYAHIGQDSKVFSLITPYSIEDLRDLGAVWDPPSTGRAIEHRAYTSVPQLRAAMEEKNWATWESPVESWTFKQPAPLEGRAEASTIAINYGSPNYTSQWTYDRENNVYLHAYNGVPHEDAQNDQQLWASTVVTMELQIWLRQGDTAGRKDMKVEGEGVATVFRDGYATVGRWINPSREERTRFVDENGEEIELNPGKLWVHVVPAFSDRVSFEVTPAPVPETSESTEDTEPVI